MIILAARPTGIASLGAPIALKKEPEAVIIPEVSLATKASVEGSRIMKPP
jgi:hypothetical protein